MRNLYRIIFLCLLLPALLPAQQNFPLNNEWSLPVNGIDPSADHETTAPAEQGNAEFHGQALVPGVIERANLSCFKPYILPIRYPETDKSKSLVFRKLKEEHLFIINDSATRFHATIDPLMNFEFGKDQAGVYSHDLYINTRGVIVRGSVGTKFAFESSVYENQSFLPKYLDTFARASQVIPGQGRWKDFKNGGFDYAMSSGYVSYSPNKHFNIQAGTGKHFVGDGYRSLLLSDNAFNYPYLRVTTTFGKFQYTNLYTSFMNIYDNTSHNPKGIERLYQKKFANFQFLSFNIHPRVQLGIFQALICQGADSTNRQHLDGWYYNPVIGLSAANYGFNNPNHLLMGSTLKIKVCRFFTLYGQYVVDDLGTSWNYVFNRQGFQGGAKFFDLFKIRNLYAQAEYNQVRPFVYSSPDPLQSYSHYNQPLADPLGANFKETILILNYRLKDFFIELKYNHAEIGADSAGHSYGQNMFVSNVLNYQPGKVQILQGLKTSLNVYEGKVGYLINPAYNLNLVAGIMIRNYKNVVTNDKTNYIYLGIRTSLTNIYTDF